MSISFSYLWISATYLYQHLIPKSNQGVAALKMMFDSSIQAKAEIDKSMRNFSKKNILYKKELYFDSVHATGNKFLSFVILSKFI